MSSNGTTNSSNVPQNDPNPNSSSRFGRQGNRRGRGRNNQERQNPTRGGYRRSNFREQNVRSVPHTQAGVIDIEDSSQWPSIQESSNGAHTRPKQTSQITGISNEQSSSPPREEIDQNELRRMNNPRPSQYSNQNYGFRDYQRYPGPRQRGGTRYSQGRGYSNNYHKRYIRTGFTAIPAIYQNDPNFINGQIYFPRAMPPPPRTAARLITPIPGQPPQPPIYNPEVRRVESRVTGIVDPVRQVEYYFSVENLTHDMFIRAQMDINGWVPIRVIHTFRRISNLNLQLKDLVEKLETSEKLEVDTENLKVRTRIEPEKWYLPEGVSIVAKGANPLYKIEEGDLLPGQSYDQFHQQQMGYASLHSPYGPVQPMLIPIQGYPRAARGRYVQQYSVYPPPGYQNINIYEAASENFYYMESESTGNSYYNTRDGRNLEQESMNYQNSQADEPKVVNEVVSYGDGDGDVEGDEAPNFYNEENEDAGISSKNNSEVETLTKHLSEMELVDGQDPKNDS